MIGHYVYIGGIPWPPKSALQWPWYPIHYISPTLHMYFRDCLVQVRLVIRQKCYVRQVRPDGVRTHDLEDHDNTSHVLEMPGLTTLPSGTCQVWNNAYIYMRCFIRIRDIAFRLNYAHGGCEVVRMTQFCWLVGTWNWPFVSCVFSQHLNSM